MNRKGLFVTFEGLSPTIADSQVIIHITDMIENGYDIELWTFTSKSRIYKQSLIRLDELHRNCDVKIRLFRSIPAIIPFSEVFNAIYILFLTYKYNQPIDYVHARTDYTTVVCGLVKFFKSFMLIWDCRGDTAAEYISKYSQSTPLRRLASPLQNIIIRCRIRLASVFCDKAIFVSSKLKDNLNFINTKKPAFEIPCVASSKIFYFSVKLREIYRQKLGISPNDKIVVYSGSMGGYQIFDKCVALFDQMYRCDKDLKFLVLTPYIEKANQFLKYLPKECYYLLTVPIEEVNGYLNAADYGMFLRESDPLNIVASPVKFAEYCLVGLPIIMTENVDQSSKIANDLGNGIMYNFKEVPKEYVCYDNKKRKAVAMKSKLLLSRESVLNKYINLYSIY